MWTASTTLTYCNFAFVWEIQIRGGGSKKYRRDKNDNIFYTAKKVVAFLKFQLISTYKVHNDLEKLENFFLEKISISINKKKFLLHVSKKKNCIEIAVVVHTSNYSL